MTYLLYTGGVPAWLILLFGILTIAAAASFGWRPTESHLGLLRALSKVTAFTTVSGFTGGLAKTLNAVAQLENAKRALASNFLMLGSSKSLSNVILGSTFLALAWLVAAIGYRRLAFQSA